MASHGTADSTIGERVASLRARRGMSQEDLAHVSGVSVSTIRKLEQRERDSASLATLHKLAAALGESTSALLRSAPQLTGPPSEPDLWAVRRLRKALTPARSIGSTTVHGVTVADIRVSLTMADELYQNSRLREAIETIASAVEALRSAESSEDSAGLLRARAMVFQMAGSILAQLHLFDLAYLALDRAADAAEQTSDDLLAAAVASTLVFLLLRQGRLDEAAGLAVATADKIEPKLSKATDGHVGVWGRLLVLASAAAVRDNRHAEADEVLSLAKAAGARLESPHRMMASPSFFGPDRPLMQEAENAVILDQPDRAIQIAARLREMPPKGSLFVVRQRCRHILDVATAQTDLRQYAEATRTLMMVKAAVPEWLPYQPEAVETTRRLLGARKRTVSPELRELADFLHVDA